ncbi:MAG TPA: WYL domain-containing protein [Prevotella sp.]|nr:WYL domain-containing protein [Prevotella sp.]
MDNRVKFYSWLISLLERRRLTFEEIANEWRDANANPEGEELQLRTFHRYRKAIESQLGICVECSGKADDAFADEKKRVRYLPFDRISYMKVICEKHPLSAKMRRFLTPDRYYEDCFGIYKMDNIEPEKIRIRAFYPEYNYIEEVPLHVSQERVRESPDGMYREYDLTVRPSYDFLQEMLWHGRNLIVLRPESLLQEMIAMLKDMTQSYETGECLNGEE